MSCEQQKEIVVLLDYSKGYLSSVWISIEHSDTGSGIVYVFLGFVVDDWSRAVELTNYGGGPLGHWQL